MSWFTPPQLAEELGVHVDRVRRWIRSGELAGVNVADSKLRPRFRVSQEAFDDFLKNRSAQQQPTQPTQPTRRTRPRDVHEFFK